MAVYRCFRVIDTKPILTHINGRTDFDDFDELLFLILLNFNLREHRLLIEVHNDKNPNTNIYLTLTDKPILS